MLPRVITIDNYDNSSSSINVNGNENVIMMKIMIIKGQLRKLRHPRADNIKNEKFE